MPGEGTPESNGPGTFHKDGWWIPEVTPELVLNQPQSETTEG